MKCFDIADIENGDEIFAVRFTCGSLRPLEPCDYEFATVPVEEMKNTLNAMMGQFVQNKCPRCGEYSGFNFLPTTPAVADKLAPGPKDLRRLCTLLTENLRDQTKDTRWEIQKLLEGRNLKLRFWVKGRAQAHAAQPDAPRISHEL